MKAIWTTFTCSASNENIYHDLTKLPNHDHWTTTTFSRDVISFLTGVVFKLLFENSLVSLSYANWLLMHHCVVEQLSS